MVRGCSGARKCPRLRGEKRVRVSLNNFDHTSRQSDTRAYEYIHLNAPRRPGKYCPNFLSGFARGAASTGRRRQRRALTSTSPRSLASRYSRVPRVTDISRALSSRNHLTASTNFFSPRIVLLLRTRKRAS